MNDERDHDPATGRPLQCARCARAPRDPDDRTIWVTIGDDKICPGCLTHNDRERLRMDRND